MDVLNVGYKPVFPAGYQPKIGIIGCGSIVRSQHLLAYKKYGVTVGGVYDISPEAIQLAQAEYDIGTVYASVDDLLSDPSIEVVDIGTHPAERVDLVLRALQAGKHVLSQKPVALDVASARRLIAMADQCGRKLAVNQNGRWSPAWQLATRLIESGVIGDVFAVTHFFDVNFEWVTRTPFDRVKHWLFYDYTIHWFDITRLWMGDKPIENIRAREYRTPNQVPEGVATWGGWAEIAYADGSHAMIRSVGSSQSLDQGHRFWIHGTQGTIHGTALWDEALTLEVNGTTIKYELEGTWFPDGFGGAMGELLCAIAEDRAPSNSAAHNLRSLQMTLAACRSAELDGQPVHPEEIA